MGRANRFANEFGVRSDLFFAAVLLVGLGWYLFVRVTHHERTRQVGTYEEEPVSASTPSSSSTT